MSTLPFVVERISRVLSEVTSTSHWLTAFRTESMAMRSKKVNEPLMPSFSHSASTASRQISEAMKGSGSPHVPL